MNISPYIMFNTMKGAEAIEFYSKKGEMKVNACLTYRDAHAELPVEGRDVAKKFPSKIFHAELSFMNEKIMLADNIGHKGTFGPAQAIVNIHVKVNTSKDVDKYGFIFAEKGVVIMKPENTAGNTRLTVVQDQFGVQGSFQYFRQP